MFFYLFMKDSWKSVHASLKPRCTVLSNKWRMCISPSDLKRSFSNSVRNYVVLLTESIKHWLTGWLCWLTDWMTEFLTDNLFYLLIYWLTTWLIDWLSNCVANWLMDYNNRLTDRLTDWLALILMDWLTYLYLATDWLIDWQNVWLVVDWPTG